jgi:MSHA biogenesis protein MshN
MAAPTIAPLAPVLPELNKRVLPEAPGQRAQNLLRQALEAAQSGHNHLASERAAEALKIDPQLHAARQLAASLALEAGRPADAEALLTEGLAHGATPSTVVLLARLRAERGDAQGALELLDWPAARGADADGLRAAVLAQRGEHFQAVPAYEAALRQQPANATWWLGLGVSLEAQGEAQRARGAYERAHQIGLPSAELSNFANGRLRALP